MRERRFRDGESSAMPFEEVLVRLAYEVQSDELSGMLTHDGRPIKASFRDDLVAQDAMWKISRKLTGLAEAI